MGCIWPMDFTNLVEFWGRHRGKIIGVILGLAFGWFAIIYGILKALFVSLCVFVGYLIGRCLDERLNWRELFSRFFQER